MVISDARLVQIADLKSASCLPGEWAAARKLTHFRRSYVLDSDNSADTISLIDETRALALGVTFQFQAMNLFHRAVQDHQYFL